MSSSKKIDIICIAMAVLALVITLLFMNGEALGLKTVVDEDAEENSDLVYFTRNDLNGNWNTSVATKIVLKDDKVKIAGSGAIVKNGNVVINSGGHYVVNGSLTDGSIIIDAKSGAKVWLLFDGVEINRNDDACIKVSNADKVFLTLAEDSLNSLTSGAVYNEEALAEGVDGAIYSHDDFTINGSGSLSVKADYKHGIAVNDALVITGGSITVSAVSGAIHANENLRICNATLNLSSQNKGIVVKDPESYFYLESGKINITVSKDAINTEGDVNIIGGEVSISAGDDGIHSEKSINISGGKLSLLSCYEGLEAPDVTISGGDVVIYPTKNGVSAKNKVAETTTETTTKSQALPEFKMSGGSLTITNTEDKTDGIDSDGNVVIDGGKIRICLNGNGNNNAVEFGTENGGSFLINGGDVLMTAGAVKQEKPSAASAQKYLFRKLRIVPAGTNISLTDAGGKTISEATPEAAFCNIIISHPDLNSQDGCKLYI
ncbi:MAG: carbohydrate-binding domain-containing protein, partial [Lachnospiraceae bacterium]|nr:carbohydrate-binding domain-containing protein [Lachnospiraceae bacterium]